MFWVRVHEAEAKSNGILKIVYAWVRAVGTADEDRYRYVVAKTKQRKRCLGARLIRKRRQGLRWDETLIEHVSTTLAVLISGATGWGSKRPLPGFGQLKSRWMDRMQSKSLWVMEVIMERFIKWERVIYAGNPSDLYKDLKIKIPESSSKKLEAMSKRQV